MKKTTDEKQSPTSPDKSSVVASSENGATEKKIIANAKKAPLKLHLPGGGTAPMTNLLVLNEVVIDRGPSPYLSNIDLYLDGKLITSGKFHDMKMGQMAKKSLKR